MEPISILTGLGLGVASNGVYDFIKKNLGGGKDPTDFEHKLDAYLNVQGQTVKASTIIDALAKEGKLVFNNSKLYAPEEIRMGAAAGASFVFGNESTSTTDRSGIVAGKGAWITGSDAAIVQSPDGSISFLTGVSGTKK
jgi:hypothetical protein